MTERKSGPDLSEPKVPGPEPPKRKPSELKPSDLIEMAPSGMTCFVEGLFRPVFGSSSGPSGASRIHGTEAARSGHADGTRREKTAAVVPCPTQKGEAGAEAEPEQEGDRQNHLGRGGQVRRRGGVAVEMIRTLELFRRSCSLVSRERRRKFS